MEDLPEKLPAAAGSHIRIVNVRGGLGIGIGSERLLDQRLAPGHSLINALDRELVRTAGHTRCGRHCPSVAGKPIGEPRRQPAAKNST